MRTFKKLISVLLVISMLICFPAIAFAKDTAEEEETVKSGSGMDAVANIYLLISTANPKLPHMWIYIENISDHTLKIGHYDLAAGDSLSMGSWKDRGQGEGIHYNMERYWIKDETYERTIYIKSTINEFELDNLSDTINRHNYWNYFFNCAWFAVCVWNCCTIKFVPFLISPYIISPFLFLYGAKKLDFEIPKLTTNKKCYKHTEEGLERLYPGVLVTSTGV